MTSWLSGGLSQFSSLTDQISSFTKDVITETTEEIEDPTAELQVARRKIQQLEEVNSHYKTEWEKLQKHSEEVRERAETAECQIAAISQEYRKLLQERDAELRRLRTETAGLREQQRKMVVSETGGQGSAQSPLKELAREQGFFAGRKRERREEGEWAVASLQGGGGGEEVVGGEGEGGGWSEYHDFGDVISSQGEINRLQMELTKLKTENRHWKTLAEEKGHSTEAHTSGPIESELSILRDQIEELQLCLQRERTQHQHQMSALKVTHRDHLHSLATQQRHGECPEGGGGGGGGGGPGGGVSEQLKEAMGEEGNNNRTKEISITIESADETIRGSLLPALEDVDLVEVDSEDNHKPKSDIITATPHSELLVASSQRCVQLELELEKMRREMEELRLRKREDEEEVVEEREKEMRVLESHREEMTSLTSHLTRLQEEKCRTESQHREEMERVTREMERLTEENRDLKEAGEALEELQTDMNNALAVNQELKKREVSLVEEKTEAEQMMKKLMNSLKSQKEVVEELQREVDRLKQHFLTERETYTQHMEEEKKQLASLVEHLQTNISCHEESITVLQDECGRSQKDAEILTHQVAQLATEVEEKENQLQQLQQITQSHKPDNDTIVQERLQESHSKISKLEETLRDMETQNEERLKRVNVEKEECIKRVKAEKEESIKRVITEKEELIEQLKGSILSISDEKVKLEENLKKMVREEKEVHDQVEELKVGQSKDKKDLNLIESKLRSLTEELGIEHREREKMEQLLTVKDSRVEELEEEEEKMRARLEQVAAERDKLGERLREREAVVEHSERNLREVGELLASRDEEIAALQRDKRRGGGGGGGETRDEEDGGRRGNEAGGALEVVTQERDQLLQHLTTRESEILSLQSRLAESQRTLDSLSGQIQQLNTHKSSLEQAVKAAKIETQREMSERDKMKEEVLGEKEREMEKVRGELAGKAAECDKLNRQLEHLKAHLVQVEEQYTHDALRAEERERGERVRAQQLHESLRNSTLIDQQESLQAKAQLAALEEQLHMMAGQRDTAILELSSAKEEAEGNATALHNLQTVLEQFQRDRSSEQKEALKKAQMELVKSLSQLDSLKTTYTVLQGQLKESQVTEELLNQQLQEKEKKVDTLQGEVKRLSGRLKTTEEALEKFMREQGGRVDQNLVKNLVVGYVQAPDRKKPEVLKLIAKILDFSPSQIQRVQTRRGGWLGGLWGRQETLSPTSTSPKLPVQGGSLSQLFVSFLESESVPLSFSYSTTTPHQPAAAPTLDPPPSGQRREPEPDPDRPSRSTTGLAPLHPTSSSSSSQQTQRLQNPVSSSLPHPSPPITNISTKPTPATASTTAIDRHTGPPPPPSVPSLTTPDSSTVTLQSPLGKSDSNQPSLLLAPALIPVPSSRTPPPPSSHPTPSSTRHHTAAATTSHHQSSILKHLLSPP